MQREEAVGSVPTGASEQPDISIIQFYGGFLTLKSEKQSPEALPVAQEQLNTSNGWQQLHSSKVS